LAQPRLTDAQFTGRPVTKKTADLHIPRLGSGGQELINSSVKLQDYARSKKDIIVVGMDRIEDISVPGDFLL